jgi:Uma2 family endonuclease
MSTVIVLPDDVEIPAELADLAAFRRWTASDAFPQQGRIDFLDGRIEVDTSPEEFFIHSRVKSAIAYALLHLVRSDRRGDVCIDRMRITNEPANLSAEPDVVFISTAARLAGRATMARNLRGRCMEIVGSPDLVVEVVSDSSQAKDTVRLPRAYFAAGIDEYWLVDARDDDKLVFVIHQRGPAAFEPVPPDADGWQHSAIFEHYFRLLRERDQFGDWEYELVRRAE